MKRPLRLLAGLVVLLALFSVLAVAGTAQAQAQEEKPNFVVIMADDLGYADLSCYGNTDFDTPNLDQMAAEGMRFTDFHSSGPVCSPTRAGLMTGRYQQRAGVDGVIYASPQQNRHHGLFPEEVTFPELLRDGGGYATAMTGKWHLGYEPRFNPVNHGFEYFRGYVSGNVCYQSHFDRMGILDWWKGAEIANEPGYSTHLITQHALEFLKAQKGSDKPFCLYVAHEAPHSPWQGPEDPAIRAEGRANDDIQRAYREMVQEMDKGVGKILAELKASGLDRNTVVFFFSDNGGTPTREGANAPLNGFKGSLWEGGHRVPMIAWWPGKIPAGVDNESLSITLDIMPTLLDLAGVEAPEGHHLDGQSLAPLLLKGETFQDRRLFWGYGERAAMRHGPWKLVMNFDAEGKNEKKAKKNGKNRVPATALFNLADDLSEQHDLAAQYAERTAAMSESITAWREDVKTGATAQPE